MCVCITLLLFIAIYYDVRLFIIYYYLSTLLVKRHSSSNGTFYQTARFVKRRASPNGTLCQKPFCLSKGTFRQKAFSSQCSIILVANVCSAMVCNLDETMPWGLLGIYHFIENSDAFNDICGIHIMTSRGHNMFMMKNM